METELNQTTPLAADVKKLRVKIFGVGTAGVAIAEQMAMVGFPSARFAAVNTDASAVTTFAEQIHLETKMLRGLGTGGDPERGRKLAEDHFEKLTASCGEVDVVFIVAGLGGGAGSGVSPVLARAARESGALVLAFVSLPFECEGNRRQQQAQQALDHLKLACDGVICLPNQKAFKLLDEDVNFGDSFRASVKLLIEGALGVWRLMMHRGIVEIHFEELCALLRERHGESCFATMEAAGEQRVDALLGKIATHPLLDGAKALEESATVLVSVLGGPDLSMKDVNRVMQRLNGHATNARVIMGAAVDESFIGRLVVTIIATSPRKHEVAQLSPVPAKTVEVETPEVAAEFCAELLPTETMTSERAVKSSAPIVSALNMEQREEIISKHTGKPIRSRKAGGPRMRQITLPLDIVNKGRFDKSEPTIHKGEDLDLPTYIRRGVALN
jgi:cell division protein FtsZ